MRELKIRLFKLYKEGLNAFFTPAKAAKPHDSGIVTTVTGEQISGGTVIPKKGKHALRSGAEILHIL